MSPATTATSGPDSALPRLTLTLLAHPPINLLITTLNITTRTLTPTLHPANIHRPLRWQLMGPRVEHALQVHNRRMEMKAPPQRRAARGEVVDKGRGLFSQRL